MRVEHVKHVERVERLGERFRIELADGSAVHARRMVVTAGLVDELPDVPGLVERWGRDVVRCSCCHGLEVRDRVIGVLATSWISVHQAGLSRQLTDRVILDATARSSAAAR